MRAQLRRLWFNWIYFRHPAWDTRISPPELLRFLDSHCPGRALDLGCGTGTNLLTLTAYGWQATGVEYAWRAVRIARSRLKEAGVDGRVLAGDVTATGLVGGPFELVLDIGCYHGIPAQRRAAYRDNLLRWLAPGGNFLLYAHCDAPGKDIGVSDADIEEFSGRLNLRDRQDGFDNPQRRAVWLRFEKNNPGA